MGESISVTRRTIDVLIQIRSNARQILQEQEELEKVTVGISSDEARTNALLRDCETLKSETRLDENYDEVDRIATHLEALDKMKARLAEELSNRKSDLLYLRKALEDELWLSLVKSGKVEADDVSDVASDPHGHHEQIGDRSDPDAGNADAMDQDPDAAIEQTHKAIYLLGAAKEDVEAARRSFHQLDGLCKAQRREFEMNMVPEWRDMSRTEFDLEQLAQRIELTRELVKAERAYSEAGRCAVEVGLIREDSDQSCHFANDPDDGACSGDGYATFAEEKDVDFIEAWREGISPTASTSPVSATGDAWEVDSVRFGEGCSTHADEWNKTKIERLEELRALARVKIGIVACPDEMICQHLPVSNCQGLPPARLFSSNQYAGMDLSRAGLWKPSLAIMKELVVSGQAAVARFSATWSTRQSGGNLICP